MTPPGPGQFGDTTFTKIFVGGLAWETQKDTMNNYFQQFGEILEAVVITDKNTGRSKGYGFVTFREADAAMRACVDANPVIDGRRANCNLASVGIQRSKPSTPIHKINNGGMRNMRMLGGFHHAAGVFNQVASAATSFPQYSIQLGIPSYNFLYGYSPYSTEYAYPASYYGLYGGTNGGQYPLYGSSNGGMLSSGGSAFYPYNINFSEGSGVATGYATSQGYGGIQYPHNLFPYSTINSTAALYPHYGTTTSLTPPTPLQSGVTMTQQR